MADDEKQRKQEQDALAIRRRALFVLVLFVLCVGLSFFYVFKREQKIAVRSQVVNEKIDDTTPGTDAYFKNADPVVYQLARKIEKKETITQEEVKALPEGALNARYGNDITLLFLALTARDLQAIDVLLASGSDPYMIDRPSYGSENDFTYYTATVTMVQPDYSFDPEATKKFRYELTKIYLKNGGRADHILDGKIPLSLLYIHMFTDNFVTAKLLIDHGANPLLVNNAGTSPIMSLVTDYSDEGLELLRYIICKGYYSQATYGQVEHALKWFEPSGPKNAKREHILKQFSMLVLKNNPEFKGNRYTEKIFGGPIPWKEIHDLKTREVCYD